MTGPQAALRSRVDLLERSGYACEACETTDVELQVHHRYYNSQAYHGDYPADSLEVLCVKCHLKADKLRRLLCKSIGKMSDGISMRALGYMEALVLEDEWQHPDSELDVRSYEHAMGIGDVFGVSAEDVFGLIGGANKITLGGLITISPLPRYERAEKKLRLAGLLP